jgi:hypothetical protein
MIDRYRAWEETPDGEDPPPFARLGVLFGLGTTMTATSEWLEGRPEDAENRIKLAISKTTFNRRSFGLAHDLVRRGWWLAGASLSKRHRALLGPLPEWRPLP